MLWYSQGQDYTVHELWFLQHQYCAYIIRPSNFGRLVVQKVGCYAMSLFLFSNP